MKYFISVVECNSFTEAAEQCYISQSAISQQIRSLEKELGVELIHRENRRFTLTPAGEYFYEQSKGILNEVEDIRRETFRIGKEDRKSTRLNSSHVSISYAVFCLKEKYTRKRAR